MTDDEMARAVEDGLHGAYSLKCGRCGMPYIRIARWNIQRIERKEFDQSQLGAAQNTFKTMTRAIGTVTLECRACAQEYEIASDR